MPAPIHPTLTQLLVNYNEVVDAFEAGHLSQADTVATLATLNAVDGAGYVWRIDPATGGFTRALGSDVPHPVDPSAFRAAQSPPTPAPPAAPSFAHAPTRPQAPTGAGPGRNLPSDDDLASSNGMRGGPLVDWVRDNMRMVGLGVAAVLLVVIFVTMRGPSSDSIGPTTASSSPSIPTVTLAPPPSLVPVAPDATSPLLPPVSEPGTSTTVAPSPEVPTGAEVDALLGRLRSADRQTVLGTVTFEAPVDVVALRAALYGGYRLAGIEMVPGPPAVGEDGSAVFGVDLVDVITGEVFRRGTLVVVWNPDTGWRLTSWPTFEGLDG